MNGPSPSDVPYCELQSACLQRRVYVHEALMMKAKLAVHQLEQ